MSVTDINETEFDAILIGSSLSHSILFAALARSGKKVALFDPQQWHGFTNSTFALGDYHRLVEFIAKQDDVIYTKQCSNGQITTNDHNDGQTDENGHNTSTTIPNTYYYCNIQDERSLKREQMELSKLPPLPTNLHDVLQQHNKRSQMQIDTINDIKMKHDIKCKEYEAKKNKDKKIQDGENNDEEIKNDQINIDNDTTEPTTNPELEDVITISSRYNHNNIDSDDEEQYKPLSQKDILKQIPYTTLTGTMYEQLRHYHNNNIEHICLPFPSSMIVNSTHLFPKVQTFTTIEPIYNDQLHCDQSTNTNSTTTQSTTQTTQLSSQSTTQTTQLSSQSTPIHIHNNFISQPFPFPLHNAYEYIPTSHLPTMKLNEIAQLRYNEEITKIEDEYQLQLIQYNTSLELFKQQYPDYKFDQIDQQDETTTDSTTTNSTTNETTDNTSQSQSTSTSTTPQPPIKPTQPTLPPFPSVNPTLDQLLKRDSYRYMIDLCAQQIYSKSLTVQSIVKAKIHDYLEFRAVNKMLMLFPPQLTQSTISSTSTTTNDISTSTDTTSTTSTSSSLLTNMIELFNYQPWEIPSSKQEIFADGKLTLRAKNKLSSLLLILMHDKHNAQCTQWHHDMYHLYQSLPIINLVFHVCNPMYKQKTLEEINELMNNTTTNTTNTTLSSLLPMNPLLQDTFSALSSLTTSMTSMNQDNNNTIQPITFIPKCDIEHDTDTILLSKLLTYGLSQYLPPSLSQYQSISQLTSQSSQSSQNHPNSILTVQIVSNNVKQHLASIGRFTKSPLLYPMYGIGEITSAWVRNGCVWGGLAIIRTGIAGMIIPQQFIQNNRNNNCQDENDKKVGNCTTQKIGIILQSGQLLTTKALFCDQIISPFALNQLITTKYEAMNNDSTPIQEENKDDNIIAPATITTADHFRTTEIQSLYQVATTQHISIIIDTLPKHFNHLDLPLYDISIQSFIIPSGGIEQFVQSYESQQQQNQQQQQQNLSSTPSSSIQSHPSSQFSSKVFITEESVGLSTNEHYMISITSTLFSKIVSDPNHVLHEYISQLQLTRQYNTQLHSKVETTTNQLPSILSTLPQLYPFFEPTITSSDNNDDNSNNEPKINTNHIKYISSHCYTTVTPNYQSVSLSSPTTTSYIVTNPIININTNETNTTTSTSTTSSSSPTTTSTPYQNIFITPTCDQTQSSTEDAMLYASHLYYGFMNYLRQIENIPILPFLMTSKEELLDEQGEVLQRLEDRNPHLAHTIDVMDDLEQQLEKIQQKEDDSVKENNIEQIDTGIQQDSNEQGELLDSNVNLEEIVNEQQDEIIQESVIELPQTEEDILASLDNLDLSELNF